MLNPVLAGQILGAAFACGLNLYAAVAVLSLGIRAGWLTDLPPGLAGLGSGLLLGSAATLYVLGFIADRLPVFGAVWEAAHTLIRPAAAAGLAIVALQDVPLGWQAVTALAAALVALAAHGSKAGLRLILAARGLRPRARLALCLAEDLLAVAVLAVALLEPETASLPILVGVALVLIAGPRLWRAAALGPHAALARARALFRRPDWRSRDQLPRAFRTHVPPAPLGRGPARAVPAAVLGLRGVGAYRLGWLVFTCDGPRFVYRALFRPRHRRLPEIGAVRLRPGFVADAIEVETGSPGANGNGGGRGLGHQPGTFTIYLLKDGPPPQVAAAELTTGAP